MTSPSYPAALDALANPGPTTETDDAGFELDIVVARLQNCIMAIEGKLGIGTGGPPATAAVLRRTATGASAWGQLATGDLATNAATLLSYAAIPASTTGSAVGPTAVSTISVPAWGGLGDGAFLFSTTVMYATAGGAAGVTMYLKIDAGGPIAMVGGWNHPVANQYIPVAGLIPLAGLAPGAHTFTLMIGVSSAASWGVANGYAAAIDLRK